jgi:hypothetical protein
MAKKSKRKYSHRCDVGEDHSSQQHFRAAGCALHRTFLAVL